MAPEPLALESVALESLAPESLALEPLALEIEHYWRGSPPESWRWRAIGRSLAAMT